ncbi:MAG: restriction endonuclease subunit S [Syntrophales bacterium]
MGDKFPIRPLCDLAEVRTGSPAPQGNEYFDPTGIPFVRVQDVGRYGRTMALTDTKDRINQHAIDSLHLVFGKKGTIVFPKSGAAINTNSRAILGIDAYVVSHLALVNAIEDIALTDWLYFYLCTVDMGQFSRTAALPSLRLSELRQLPIPCPRIDEQRRIVARIQECLVRVEEIEGNSAAINKELSALFPAILNETFSGLIKNTTVQRLEDVADIKGGGSLPNGTAQDISKEAALLVKVGDMNKPGNERTIKVSRAYLALTKTGNKLIDEGAVIFPKRGGAIATNKKRLLGRPALIDPNLMAVIAKPGKLLSEYLYYWTQTLDLTDISNGGVVPQLNRKDLAPLEIPVPDLRVQESICGELEQAERTWFELRSLFDDGYQERKTLRECILRKAFAGEL